VIVEVSSLWQNTLLLGVDGRVVEHIVNCPQHTINQNIVLQKALANVLHAKGLLISGMSIVGNATRLIRVCRNALLGIVARWSIPNDIVSSLMAAGKDLLLLKSILNKEEEQHGKSYI
jgi:hypothetical protein